LEYAFFVVMGGFHIEKSRIDHFLSPSDDPTVKTRRMMGDVEMGHSLPLTLPSKAQGILDLCKTTVGFTSQRQR
jgi:hypothetical protein